MRLRYAGSRPFSRSHPDRFVANAGLDRSFHGALGHTPRARLVLSAFSRRSWLWSVPVPALRDAAEAMMAQSGPRLLDAHAKEERRAARDHILNDLEQLEGRYPTLEPRKSVAFATILIYPQNVGSGRR